MRLRHAEIDDGLAFQFRLHEDAVGLLQQPTQGRPRVLFARAVVWIVRIAEVQERREEERHVLLSRETKAAHDREGVGESRRVNGVERAVESAGVPPHRRADRIAR